MRYAIIEVIQLCWLLIVKTWFGSWKVCCITILLFPKLCVLTSRESMSTLKFFRRNMWENPANSNLASMALAFAKYFYISLSLARYPLLIWKITHLESLITFIFLAPSSSTIHTPAMQASYSAWLLVVGKEKFKACLTIKPYEDSNKT